jgi:hypothetical protein
MISLDPITRESDVFQHGVGQLATSPGCARYRVTHAYLDSNGCMKTEGVSDRGLETSFILDTQYAAPNP